MTSVTHILLGINIAVYFLELNAGGWLLGAFALWPWGQGFLPWQMITHAFLHANLSHLVFNMFGLWMFGKEMEGVWGPKRFTVYYLVSAVSGGMAQLLVKIGSDEVYPTVGASGAIFGLLLAFAMYFPHRKLMLLFPPIPMPAWLFASLYAGVELVMGVTGTKAGVAHFAHLGGMLGGYLLIRYWRGQTSLWR